MTVASQPAIVCQQSHSFLLKLLLIHDEASGPVQEGPAMSSNAPDGLYGVVFIHYLLPIGGNHDG